MLEHMTYNDMKDIAFLLLWVQLTIQFFLKREREKG